MLKHTDIKLLDSDVLKVGHHGSDSSSTEEFLNAVTPDFALIPTGRNTYGHPASSVTDRLKALNSVIFRSDYNKDVIFILTKDGINNIIYS